MRVANQGASPIAASYVAQNSLGYGTAATIASAKPFRFEATQLGRYTITDSDGKLLYMAVINQVLGGTEHGARADWTVTKDSAGYHVANTETGQALGSWSGLLAVAPSTIQLAPSTGCFTPPGVTVGATGASAPAVDSAGNLVGLIDAHAHITAAEAFGGQMHCGSSFAEGGPSVALAGCASHGTLAPGALFEALIGGTDPLDSSEDGWPTFTDWPTDNSLLHEQAYYVGIERAWRGGLRVMNTLLVGNRVICELYPSRDHPCDEMGEVLLQAQYLSAMEDYIDAQNGGPGLGWFRIAETPEQVRTIAAQGKLAVTIGVENSELFGCREISGVPQCSEDDIDDGLDQLQALGVSGLYPVHKFDNAFGGTRFDAGVTGAAINVGNYISTGHWWRAASCTGPADNEQPITNDGIANFLAGGVAGAPAGTVLPVYPTGPICNTQGLTALGVHLIEEMMDRGMIIHIDHMGVKTAKAVLDMAEAVDYAGVASVHTWADRALVNRVIGLGGFVASYAYAAADAGNGEPDFVSEWRANNALPNGSQITGYGYGSDVNGLAPQAPARLNAAASPLKYPFTAPNGVVFQKQSYGSKVYDLNIDGVAQYGLYADWVADLVKQAGTDGPALRADLMSGAEAYVTMWEQARS